MELIELDGSYGEGGGQILRTAIAFSVILGKPIHVTRIRAGRRIPGLRPQHAATLRILRDTSGGRLEGCSIGSTEVRFFPSSPESSSLKISLGTAASITLILQALIPAISLSKASLDLELVGGTDVPWSPTSDYLVSVLLPALRLIGIEVELEVRRRGYYPRGGGIVRAKINPCSSPNPVDLASRGSSPPLMITSRCGRLPRAVAERQASSASSVLLSNGINAEKVQILEESSLSPGTSLLISMVGSACYIGSDSIGARGKRAEVVGEEAAKGFMFAFKSRASVDSHLADMLAPILCLSSSRSRLLVPEITSHLQTSLYVANLFTGCEYAFSGQDSAHLITIAPH